MKRLILKKLIDKLLKRKPKGEYIKINGKKVYLTDIYTAEGLINIEIEDRDGR